MTPAALGVAIFMGGCATVAPLEPAPVVEFTPGMACSTSPDTATARTFDPEAKGAKSQLRSRNILMRQDMMAAPGCLDLGGRSVPYVVFAIPTGFERRVVTAGGSIDPNSIFAASVATLDADGTVVRRFPVSQFRRSGSEDAVQFAPANSEVYVLVMADPGRVGEGSATTETTTGTYYVANGYGGGGTNTTGQTRSYSRTYSYDGFATLRTTYPKQEKR